MAARGPDAGVGGAEIHVDRGADRCRQMRDPGVVADEEARAAEPAGQLAEVAKTNPFRAAVFWSGQPADGHGAAKFFKIGFERAKRGAFGRAAGEGVDHGEGAVRGRAVDPRIPRGVRSESARLVVIEVRRVPSGPIRQGGEEVEGQAEFAHQFPELGPLRPIPGNDGVEAAQALDHVVGVEDAEAVESGGYDGSGRVGEAGERDVLFGAPDLGIGCAEGLERGQADDEIADGAGTNQKASQMNHLL